MTVYPNVFQSQINPKTLVAHLMKVIDNNAAGDMKPLTVLAIGGTYKESILAKSYYNDPKWQWTANPDELPPAHALAIIGYNPMTKQLLIRNPHNKLGKFGSEFTMSVDDFVKAFAKVTFEK